MRVISKKKLIEFSQKHTKAKGALFAWYEKYTNTEWEDFNHLKASFPSLDFVGKNHYVFNIKGNDFRLVVVIQFTPQVTYIRFIGTHAQYDKIKDIEFL